MMERGAGAGGEGSGGSGGGGGEEEEDEEEAGPVYNPLNLPLDFDGKPIPYWLYRLHGLNLHFSCGICGGEVYKGRREFDRHFQESRHAAGMKALGIPNTRHFHDITSIDAARARACRAPARNSRSARVFGGGGFFSSPLFSSHCSFPPPPSSVRQAQGWRGKDCLEARGRGAV